MVEGGGTSQNSLQELTDDEPQRHDLFLGLVAPIGSSKVLEQFKVALKPYNYDVQRVHLAGLLETIPPSTDDPLPDRGSPNYYKRRMDAGDRLRREAGDQSALAALSIANVASDRQARILKVPADKRPTVYIFDSLKHPREARLLRAVYGSSFWLVAIVQDIQERVVNLSRELGSAAGAFDSAADSKAMELIARDEADPDAAHGQHVRDVYALSDFFLAVREGMDWQLNLERLCAGMYGKPFMTPTADEEAMRHANAAALRSAALGRQVGAVIVPKAGAPLITGTNEVPRPGGGQYREGDRPDFRDFRTGSDPNPAYTERVILELLGRLAEANFFSEDRNRAGGAAVLKEAATPGPTGKSILDGTRAKSLIEFTRCLHAEQAAIVDAARTGTAIGGGRLHTTTFPCHECTKFIVGAGIVELQYIEPYPKSLAGDLYKDLIDTRPPMDERSSQPETAAVMRRVPFRSFVGFGPSRYDEVFIARGRRTGTGVAAFDPGLALPIGRGWSEIAVRTREDEVVLAIADVVFPAEPAAKEVGEVRGSA